MQDYDYDMPEIIRSSKHTARKDHTDKCECCKGRILKGQTYTLEVGLDIHGDFFTSKTHVGRCHLRYWGITEGEVLGEVRSAEAKPYITEYTRSDLREKAEAVEDPERRASLKARIAKIKTVWECPHTGCMMYDDRTPVDPERFKKAVERMRAQDAAMGW